MRRFLISRCWLKKFSLETKSISRLQNCCRNQTFVRVSREPLDVFKQTVMSGWTLKATLRTALSWHGTQKHLVKFCHLVCLFKPLISSDGTTRVNMISIWVHSHLKILFSQVLIRSFLGPNTQGDKNIWKQQWLSLSHIAPQDTFITLYQGSSGN